MNRQRIWTHINCRDLVKRFSLQAIACLKRANYLAPFEWKILYNLGLSHLHMQQYASAFSFFSAALNFRQKDPQLFMLLAGNIVNTVDSTSIEWLIEWLQRKHNILNMC